ncbi:MAG: hypothetical protein ACF8QF_09685 [Phycisphaerales bacterium]
MDNGRHTVTFGRGAALLACALGVAGCQARGSRQLPVDRFNYNQAIANSANEQMLLNLVRLHHGEVPTFLAVNSVLTQYVWTGEAGIFGSGGESLDFPAWSVGGNANVRYIERPTVTYTPLSGQEFATQLLSPVRAEVVFSLVSSGWPPRELLLMTLQRIGDIENIGFASARATAGDDQSRFERAVDIIIELARHDAIELVRSADPASAETYLEFVAAPAGETAALVDEFRAMLGLDDAQTRYRVTRRIVGREPGEITIRTHSLLELMGLLSAGVGNSGGAPAGPLAVGRSVEAPADALVAVEYRGGWYGIDRSDEQSKRAFGLLIYLFQMQASQGPGVGPVLTVPVG